jgi:diguanylate cyclase (GGDEF)-like protein
MDQLNRVLLVEDSPEYAVLVREMLREAFGDSLDVVHCELLSASQRELHQQPPDCLLLDLSLPDANGLEALETIQGSAPEVPVVVLSGQDDMNLAVQAVQEGAQDYLVKRQVDGHHLSRAIRYAVERKRWELQLAHWSLHDSLTGLPNRTLFLDRLEHALARSARPGSWLAVLFLDLDRFKTVNDSLGHEIGDRLLTEVAKRMQELVRPGDTIARFGGDEFMVLCEDICESDAIGIANRISSGVAEPFLLEGREIFVGVSIGIALSFAGDMSADALIQNADATMYRAKERSTPYELFDEEVHAGALRRLAVENELHRALERRELRVFYQPEVDLSSGELFGLEALLRWEHPERGLLEAREFVPVAEETGLIVPIGEWVLDEACQFLKACAGSRASANGIVISVNLSARQLMEPGLVENVAATLRSTGVDPASLCFEITEGSVIRDPGRAVETLHALKSLGVVLGIDDFGTGYSSLSALCDYPIDIVKIDRSLVAPLGAGPEGKGILSAAVAITRSLELEAIAEGIESVEQASYLRDLGCSLGQGYYFGRPGSAASARDLMNRKLAAAGA